MGVYIGWIDKRLSGSTVFFNFKPIAEVRQNEIIELSATALNALLPESARHDINFFYQWNSTDDLQEMERHFRHRSLTIFEFELSDLEDNIYNGARKQTGYYVNALKMLDNGKIRKLSDDGVYELVDVSKECDFYAEPIVIIDVDDVNINDEVYVDLGDFLAGPYRVDYRPHTQSYYVRPEIKNRKYTITGYNPRKCFLITLSESKDYWSSEDTYEWTVLLAGKESDVEQIDTISDALLIESFQDSIGVENIKDGRVSIDDIDSLLSQYETSLLTGAQITTAIRKRRLNRLVDLLTAEEELTDTLSLITESICSLLVRHKDLPEVDMWLQELLKQHPEFWDQIRDVRLIGTKISQLNQDVEELQQQKDSLDAEIQQKQEAADSINQQAIEEKKREMLAVDTRYAEKKKELDSLIATLGVVEDIAKLQKDAAHLRTEVNNIQTHYDFLRDASRNMQTQFSQLLNNQHDQMVGLAFDGFMSNKMLKAAAEWESEEANRLSEEYVDSANSIPAEDKSTEDLVDYLVRTVQILRPQYSRNTILNIAICTTQGFLTVFSGEPGCGKTSICNIWADVLGLNKIEDMMEETNDAFTANRYVPVSVERGWTSKRDFIGYFNPLSKTFDKSNRDVYDALTRLHIEQNKGLNKFPFVILLDEANLSPMEYYWADFMYVCDAMSKKRKINLGDNNVLSIPDTLHFVATINNDHTIETLSPRLIDRAWIVQLPQQVGPVSTCSVINDDQIEVITWNSLNRAFNSNATECITLPSEIQKIYDAVSAHLRDKLFVSPRVEIAIKRYWAVASAIYEKELGIEPAVVALDYAVAQKILPKIQGHGGDYEKWLEKLRSILNANDLNMSAKIVKDIIERGSQQMKYFQFFA